MYFSKLIFLTSLLGGLQMYSGEINRSSGNYVDFVIIRHGETPWNENKPVYNNQGDLVQGPVIQGATDIPLNANGLSQAQKAAEIVNQLGFEFTKVYTSPLLRAAKTAEIVAQVLNLPVLEEPHFAACSWGDCEGKSKQYRVEQYGFDNLGNVRIPGWELLPTKERWKIQPIPDAESMNSVYERMRIVMMRIAEESSPSEAILLASHQENIKTFSLFCQAEEIEKLRLEGKLDEIASMEASPFKNCGYYHFRYDLSTREFRYYGEVVHVENKTLQKVESIKENINESVNSTML